MDCESNTPYLFSIFLFISRFSFQYRAKRTFCLIILQIYRLVACVLGNIQYRNRANQTKSKQKFQRFSQHRRFLYDFASNNFRRIENKADAEYVGGFNLFGKHFGDYEQDISVSFVYAD